MPGADPSVGWGTFFVALAFMVVGSFLVTYIPTDLWRMRRTPFIGLLALATGAATWWYLWATGTDATEFLRNGWAWGLVGAAASGSLTGFLARRVPPTTTRPRAWPTLGKLTWEGVVYGAAEGTLLSILPVIAVWQGGAALEWTRAWPGKIGVGVLAMVASAVVIGIHHLGYREFRGPQIRYPILACGFFSLAYLATGSVIAAIGGHILLHVVMVLRGAEMPPGGAEMPSHQEPQRPRTSITNGFESERTADRAVTVGR
jgi:hypothetical protein